jgi:uncharacterized protein YdiU (UPF0061 family)
MGEAMHALGIPTTRALAVVTTGAQVQRDRALPGAVLCRVAASHLRVGTVQYNTTISGETIDYRPCAFMDTVDPATVFSSLDTTGHYAYGTQPSILQWNLARLGESLLPLLGGAGAAGAVEDVLASFPEAYDEYWAAGMAAKLGLRAPAPALATDLMALLHAQQVDFTTFFRALSAGTARDLFLDGAAFDAWAARREALLPSDRAGVAAGMDRVNPLHIPRNHLTDAALGAAEQGDLAPFHQLLDAISSPFDHRPGLEAFIRPAPGSVPHITYCGT